MSETEPTQAPQSSAPSAGPQKKILLILAGALLTIGLLLAASKLAGTKAGAGPAGAASATPALSLPDLQGNTVSLEQYRGKVVLLNFWATYCEPCKVEMPWFAGFHEKYGPQGLAVVGVAMDPEGKSIVEPFLQTEEWELDGRPVKIEYPILIGNEAVGDKFGLFGLPTTIVISRDGKMVKRFVGLVSHDAYLKEIEAQLQQP